MKLRLQPWFTDSCATFLNNLFKWYPACAGERISILEWGGGNSTLYFLGKGCRLLTIESDEAYIARVVDISRSLGFKVISTDDPGEAVSGYDGVDLTILRAKSFQDAGEVVFDHRDWSMIVNDGISRKEVVEAIVARRCSSIVILDNVEYCANWGKLERGAAHPERVKSYRNILRDPYWSHYLFEQAEGRDGHSAPDSTGWEAPNRWISGVLWPNTHLLAKLMVSHIGLPVVTLDALDDADIETLSQRCPFDWEQMKWLVDEYTEVFELPRSFE